MKRIFTLLAAVSMVISAMAQASGITLAYDNGKEMLVYPANKLYQAIEKAKPNDILYFSAGEFSLNDLEDYESGTGRQITKPLNFIGVGAFEGGTKFTSDRDLYLNIDEDLIAKYTDVKVKKEFSFEGIRFESRYVKPVSDIDKILFRNYYGRYSSENNDDDALFSIGKLLIDRCEMDYVNLKGENVKSADINNSKITNRLYGYSGKIEDEGDKGSTAVIHSKIQNLDGSFSGIVKYSLVYSDQSDVNTEMIACGTYSSKTSDNKDDKCFKFSYSQWNSSVSVDDNPASHNPAWGTLDNETNPASPSPVGTTGGSTPFSLNSSYPTPYPGKSSIEYDELTKGLTVKVVLYGEENSANN